MKPIPDEMLDRWQERLVHSAAEELDRLTQATGGKFENLDQLFGSSIIETLAFRIVAHHLGGKIEFPRKEWLRILEEGLLARIERGEVKSNRRDSNADNSEINRS